MCRVVTELPSRKLFDENVARLLANNCDNNRFWQRPCTMLPYSWKARVGSFAPLVAYGPVTDDMHSHFFMACL
jgi:hypothetical protein